MKIFKYKFSKLAYTLICVGFGLCFIGLGLNIFLVVTDDIASSANMVYPIIQYSLMFLIPIVLLVILISLLVSSYYSIDENTLTTSFGIIKSKYDIGSIQTVLLDRTTNKLTVFFDNASFIVIVVKEDWYDEFTDALLKVNRNIEFSINSKERSDKDDKDDKKKS